MYFRQFLSGRDHAIHNPAAANMANFSYAIGCSETKECSLIDPAWDVKGLTAQIKKDGYELTKIIATHYHWDHIGGSKFGMDIEGVSELSALTNLPIFCHEDEKKWILQNHPTLTESLNTVCDQETISVGNVKIKCIHTPGHSEGGMCLEANQKLIVGDTLFQEGCGRTDIPGGNTETLLQTIKNIVAKLDNNLIVYAGHNYGHSESMTLGEIKQINYIFS